MAEKYDVVVIGAGNGGLMAALRATKMGLKTLVIERNNTPGGAAASFVRGRFEFEASLHEIPDFGEGELRGNLGHIFDELGIDCKFLQVSDAFRLVVADGKDITMDVTVPHGKKEFYAFMESECPGISPVLDIYFEAAKEMERGLEYLGKSRGRPDPQVLRTEYESFCKILSLSAGEFMRTIGMPQRAIDIISAYWPYQGADMDTIDASRYLLMTAGYFLAGAFVPSMRSHDIANAIEKRARQLGCDFWYNTTAESIGLKDGAVDSVTTSDGRTVNTCAVISNAFPEDVYGKMISASDRSQIPEFEIKKMNARTLSFRGFVVYLGLDRSPEELGIKDYNIFINSTTDTKVLFDNSASRTILEDDFVDNVTCTCLNIVKPDCSPAGTTHYAITMALNSDVWEKVTPEDYASTKRFLANKLIDRAESVLGLDLRSHIEEISIATPVTFARYMNTPQGSIYGYHSSTWDGMSSRTLAGGSEQTIPGLYFCGAHGNRLSGFLPTLAGGDQIARPVMGYVMGGGKR
ncbi:MAG: NAD(P)/FAD-dependent oxidoreductase [Clostridiales bacterium]|nr:NAD(P)/FAD-dependent oxidoreductase [Clostridiales bacterium]